jgi:hypothetical protein
LAHAEETGHHLCYEIKTSLVWDYSRDFFVPEELDFQEPNKLVKPKRSDPVDLLSMELSAVLVHHLDENRKMLEDQYQVEKARLDSLADREKLLLQKVRTKLDPVVQKERAQNLKLTEEVKNMQLCIDEQRACNCRLLTAIKTQDKSQPGQGSMDQLIDQLIEEDTYVQTLMEEVQAAWNAISNNK